MPYEKNKIHKIPHHFPLAPIKNQALFLGNKKATESVRGGTQFQNSEYMARGPC